jgi:rhodanese-related sulfurtransferase
MRNNLFVGCLVMTALSCQAPPAVAQLTVFGAQAPFLDDAIVKESSQGPVLQVSTAELKALLSSGAAVVLDARPPEEFGISHIPGALNVSPKPGVPISVYVSDVEEVKRIVSDINQLLVLYCNGPFCGKSKRLGVELLAAGFTNVRRYQFGMPGWRTMGGAAVIELEQLRQVAKLDRTAVFVDAGLTRRSRFRNTVRILPGEAVAAKDDGRLPMHDHNTRIVVVGTTGAQARVVAEEITANAFHNVAYYDGDADGLRRAGAPSPGHAVSATPTASACHLIE